jgi:hypothetical protein
MICASRATRVVPARHMLRAACTCGPLKRRYLTSASQRGACRAALQTLSSPLTRCRLNGNRYRSASTPSCLILQGRSRPYYALRGGRLNEQCTRRTVVGLAGCCVASRICRGQRSGYQWLSLPLLCTSAFRCHGGHTLLACFSTLRWNMPHSRRTDVGRLPGIIEPVWNLS